MKLLFFTGFCSFWMATSKISQIAKPLPHLSTSILYFSLGIPLSGSVQDGRGGGGPNAEGLTDNKPIILYESSSQQGSEIPYTTWMLLMSAVVAVVFIMQAAIGMCYCVLRKQMKRMKRHGNPDCDDVSVSTVGSYYNGGFKADSEYNVKL